MRIDQIIDDLRKDFDGWVRLVTRPFQHQFAVLQSSRHLPLKYASLVQAFNCMLANNILPF